MGHLLDNQAEVSSFDRYKKKLFTRLCCSCYLDSKLKILQNTFLFLVYPDNLVSKLITRVISLTAF